MCEDEEYNFKWYSPGDNNPFNKKVLDIRSFTETIVTTTSTIEVAEKYGELRSSMGEEFIDVKIEDEKNHSVFIEYPHNGDKLEGVVFKANSMECKWDIYIYNNTFYFTRSWTGQLVYKAKVKNLSSKLILTNISYDKEVGYVDALNDIHFLIMSHAMRRQFPHKIPSKFTENKDIALYSFSQFGNRACYATYEDIMDTIIK